MLLVRKLNLLFFAKKVVYFCLATAPHEQFAFFCLSYGRVRAIIRKYKLAGAANARILEVSDLGVQS
jgi:hypothetical protein